MLREKTAAAVKKAGVDWDNAPAHIKVMAGKHVQPLLDALKAINMELEGLREDLIRGIL